MTSTYATISNLASTGSTLATNLANTGSTLQTNINNLSSTYATITNLASSGSTLNARINNLSGYINSTSSNIVFTTGNQTISGTKTFIQDTTFGDSAQGDFLVISGNQFTVYGSGNFTSGLFVNGNPVLTGSSTLYATTINLASTGSTLDSKINSLSGNLTSTYATISNLASTGSTLDSKINSLSGNLTSTYATISNLSSTGSSLDSKINTLSGYSASIVNLALTGSTLNTKIDNLSGVSVLTFGNQIISGVKTFANGSNQILNITYSSLTGLKAISGLLSGQLYRISDFVLKWNNQSYNDPTVKTAASGEPLIVTALSNKQIYHIAQSEIYPQDTIYYNIDASTSYSWGNINNNVNIPDFKGWIYRRIDNLLNIDIPYDWRNITVNCCKPDVSSVPYYFPNVQYNRLDYVIETGNNSNRGKLFYSTVTGNSGNSLNNNTFWSSVSAFVESGTFFSTDENYGFKALFDNINIGDYIINLRALTTSRIQQPTFTSTLTGLGTFTLNNVKNIKIEDGFSNVIIGNSFTNNTIATNFTNNTIAQNFDYNTIGDGFNNNAVGNLFYNNAIAYGFSNNTIGEGFHDNAVGNLFQYSTIAYNFAYNTIGYYFSSNTIAYNFNNNTIENGFYGNIIINYFQYNTIRKSFNNNSIQSNFQVNTIENEFYYNTIGNNFSRNTIGHSVNYNTIGNNFNNNTIGSNFNYNTIGNGFNSNIAENDFYNIDFTSSTHVYNNYNTTLFQNSENSMRLRYFNSSDQLVVTDPTA